jgi:hypothetical protein
MARGVAMRGLSLSQTASGSVSAGPPSRLLQRNCACGGVAGLTGRCEGCERKRLARPSISPLAGSVLAPPSVERVLAGPGRPLDSSTRSFMERRFGHDLSRVRVHTVREAARSAQQVNARAYTVGSNIVFAMGAYAPTTKSGRKLIAHELAHVLQQSGSRSLEGTDRPPLTIAETDHPLEHEAETIASIATEYGTSTGKVSSGHAANLMMQRQAGAAPSGASSPPGSAPSSCLATVSTSAPATCPGRHTAYAAAHPCFPSNPWLGCVDEVSGRICELIDAFNFTGAKGNLARLCVAATPGAVPAETRAKAAWFNSVNACIWGHWRTALDAIHDATVPIPSGLSPEWASAVAICRASGVGGGPCCHAHVVAEQSAIDRCGLYDSARFGRSPSEMPGAPTCSAIGESLFGETPEFVGDFGKLADRISYGDIKCCSRVLPPTPAPAPPVTPPSPAPPQG